MDATPFARELAEPVRQALALLDSALAHGPGFDPASATRAFRFYMSDLGLIEFLPPLLERVQKTAPGVRLEAVALEVEDIAGALAAGALDLAVGFLPSLGPPVRRRALFRDPYLNTYGVLNVRDDFAVAHPDVIERVLRAYDKARQWAIKNPEQTSG